jgi:hypothetical protein
MKPFLIGLWCSVLLSSSASSKAEQPPSFNLNTRNRELNYHPIPIWDHVPGMPKVAVCLSATDPLSQNPEEENQTTPESARSWKRIYEQPDHVFFSHRRHVVLGKMECTNCHGDIGQSEKPPSTPWVRMTMDWCMDCHAKKKVTNDCLACHV